MNSERERAILEAWGWTFDSVQRRWTAPDKFVVTVDDLMAAAMTMGEKMEARLHEVAQEHGKKP